MMVPVGRFSPGHILLAVALLCLAACLAAVVFLARQPWLGLALVADGDGVRIAGVHPGGPAAGMEPFAGAAASEVLRLKSVGGIELQARDLIEEPDFVDSYAEMCEILDRQSQLAAVLRSGPLALEVGRRDGSVERVTVVPAPTRPVSDLPAVFWFQLFAGGASLLVGAWVWVLRPRDWGTRMFALTGAMFLASALSAAVYSSRELAIDGTVFRWLSTTNHFGALMFGAALINLFLCHPRQIVSLRYLLAVPLVFVPWVAVDALQLAPNHNWGVRLPIVVAMMLVTVFAYLQWRLTAEDPRARAALTWLSLSVILGCGMFVLSTIASQMLGWLPPMKQGYAFGFFLVMYAGLALGLRRYRLFELDEWAFRILMWVGGAVGLVLLDGLLLLALGLEPFASLGVALLVAGFFYLPARNALWRAIVERRRIPDDELFQAVMDVAFKATEPERVDAWHALVRRMFDPLELEVLPAKGGQPMAGARSEPSSAVDRGLPSLRLDGLEMLLPAVAASPALAVRYPWQGRELFGTAHARLARQMVELMRHAEAGRAAHEAGVLEERRRVARDLHDDLGAKLLTALNRPDLPGTRQAIREAIAEMRSVLSGLSGERADLAVLMADLRHETASRLEAAGIALEWPLTEALGGVEIDQEIGKSLASAHRELVSNVIRHSGATRMQVGVKLNDGWLEMNVRDDGMRPCGSTQEAEGGGCAGGGRGLRNLRRRIDDLGGTLSIELGSPGCPVGIRVPLMARRQRRRA